MLVYGDPSVRARLDDLVRDLRALAAAPQRDPLAYARRLLIRAGQFEQGVADLEEQEPGVDHPLALAAKAITDAAAACFLDVLTRATPAGDQQRAMLRASLDGAVLDRQLWLEIKVPEGFEFYTLFPEQYCLAAEQLVADAGPAPRHTLVVGVRSIGTSLSALVTAVLRRRGWDASRLTVRPSGHPFARTVHLPASAAEGKDLAVVVDEGPGLSGSSMAAVAAALHGFGIRRSVFLPGHRGMPGAAANADIRSCWERTARYVSDYNDLRWDGKSLQEHLLTRAAQLLDVPPRKIRLHDASCGRWRALAYEQPSEWPAVAAAFERTKYLCIGRDGRGVMWKFDGLGSITAAHQRGGNLDQYSTTSAVRILVEQDRAYGFAATRWINGVRLRRAGEIDPAVLVAVSRYLRSSAGPPLTPAEHEAAVNRLRHMLLTNAGELLGSEVATGLCEPASAALAAPALHRYTDGRMAPHEFIRDDRGMLHKADSAGHTGDHTMIGVQSLLWDVAGLVVEWGLQDSRHKDFVLNETGFSGCAAALDFYGSAYAAFRAGMLTLSLASAGADEVARLQRDCQYYQQVLRPAVASPAWAGQPT